MDLLDWVMCARYQGGRQRWIFAVSNVMVACYDIIIFTCEHAVSPPPPPGPLSMLMRGTLRYADGVMSMFLLLYVRYMLCSWKSTLV